MANPVERIASLTIGSVESVSPSEIKVLLDTDAPQTVALNTGVPTGFPRINGYVLIPSEDGAVVGLVVWLGVERSVFPKRTELKDFGLIDLPFPLRKLVLTPLGTLRLREAGDGACVYELNRGISAFPCVGDAAHLPTPDQLHGIIEACREEDQRVTIGTSPLAANAKVTVDPDKLFGRHLAVLGNTGSGKSCSVAGLIRWCIEAAHEAKSDRKRPNARFIILDPNGEYAHAFGDFPDRRLFHVPPPSERGLPLLVPGWMWNSNEWSAFTNAAPGVQRPLLLQALRGVRSVERLRAPAERQIALFARGYRSLLLTALSKGPVGHDNFPGCLNCGNWLTNIAAVALAHADSVSGDLNTVITSLAGVAEVTATRRRRAKGDGFNGFNAVELEGVIEALEAVLAEIPDQDEEQIAGEDAPLPFDLPLLPSYLDDIAADQPGGQAAQFVATLTMRIRMMLANGRLGPIVNPPEGQAIGFEQWLSDYIGADQAINGELAIIDLSLVPSDVVHIITAIIGRIIFEAVQRYRRLNGSELPTVLVMEEAHTFVRRGADEEDTAPSAAQMCRQTFERIAREGRKFGLGLILSSQRPSELSPTVLAQCNTFLIHRVVNDRDQELLGKLVPDNLGGLLAELPSLPTRHAILLGWATSLPTLVEVSELPKEQRPRSDDPHFWDVWTGREDRLIKWKDVVEDWIGMRSSSTVEDESAGDSQLNGRRIGTPKADQPPPAEETL